MLLFTVTEGWRRRQVSLSEQRWREHIEPGHPELRGQLGEIAETLSAPHFVYQDKDAPDTELYYRVVGAGRLRNLTLKVVVRFDEGGRGEVITAYPTSRLGTHEGELLWVCPRPTRT
jgi:hypothetical protein